MMTTEESIFEQALALTPTQREAFLLQVCGADDELRKRIQGLVAADSGHDSLLDRPIDLDVTVTQVQGQGKIQVGSQIGPYKLLEEIGEGGMGIVYVAERRKPIRSRVAIKVIKPGMDSRAVIARFEAERQALAMMEHPNIAKVLDAGTTENGQPYFVMEHIKGTPITEYCNEHCLSTSQRIRLFRQVCSAVQHSHQKGIIHRDLKPSNILVADYDHEALPKVIDFGVAKALNQNLTDKTVYTQRLNIVGTLQYMSPEQAKMNQRDVDTRSDIYSLGVVLYELLTNQPPFAQKMLEDAGLEGMCRIIREQEPAKPSESLQTLDKQAASQVAKDRNAQPEGLRKAFRGDLDRIVMMALAKERQRRYDSASSLSRDLERYMNNEPVQAVSPSWTYLVAKSMRRHKSSYIIAGTLLFALLATSCSLFVGLQSAMAGQQAAEDAKDQVEKEKRQAVAAKDSSDKALGLVLSLVEDVAPDKLVEVTSKASDIFESEPDVELRVLDVLGRKRLTSLATKPTDVFLRLKELTEKQHGRKSLEHAEALRYLSYCSNDVELAREAVAIEKAISGVGDWRTLSILGGLLFFEREFDSAVEPLDEAMSRFDADAILLEPWEVPHLFAAEIERIRGNREQYASLRNVGLGVLRKHASNVSVLLDRGNNSGDRCPILEFREWYLASVDPDQLEWKRDRSNYNSSYSALLQSLGRSSEADRFVDPKFVQDLGTWALAERAVTRAELMDFQSARDFYSQSLELGKRIEAGLQSEDWALPWQNWQIFLTEYLTDDLDAAKERMATTCAIYFGRQAGFANMSSVKFDLVKNQIHPECRYYLLQKLLVDENSNAEELLKLAKSLRAAAPTWRGAEDFDPDVCLALAYRRLGKTTQALDLLESSQKSVSLTCNAPIHWMEQILFELYEEAGDVNRAVKFMDEALQYRDQGLHWEHPENGLARYRFGKFLVKHEIESVRAKEYLSEAKEMLSGRSLLPKHILPEIDELLAQLE